jgi:hypothetical protein
MSDDRKNHPVGSPEWSKIQARIRKGEVKVEFASKDAVTALQPFVDQILRALRVAALVTDESMFSDFRGAQPLGVGFDTWLERLSEELGVEIDSKSYIIDVARRMAEKAGALH